MALMLVGAALAVLALGSIAGNLSRIANALERSALVDERRLDLDLERLTAHFADVVELEDRRP